MSRRKSFLPSKRYRPDPIHGDPLLGHFISTLMKKGKRTLALRIFYGALDFVKNRSGEDGVQVFHKAIAAIEPQVEVRSKRVGGATYQIPIDVSPNRRRTLAIRWLIRAARERKEYGMIKKLGMEIVDISKGQGGTVKKLEENKKMAEANKAFSHYR